MKIHIAHFGKLSTAFIFILLLSLPAEARGVKKALLRVAGHVAIGAGTEVAISQLAGSSHKYVAGITAAGAVAAFKESADCIAGADTKKQAAIHALTILAGAVTAAAIKH